MTIMKRLAITATIIGAGLLYLAWKRYQQISDNWALLLLAIGLILEAFASVTFAVHILADNIILPGDGISMLQVQNAYNEGVFGFFTLIAGYFMMSWFVMNWNPNPDKTFIFIHWIVLIATIIFGLCAGGTLLSIPEE